MTTTALTPSASGAVALSGAARGLYLHRDDTSEIASRAPVMSNLTVIGPAL